MRLIFVSFLSVLAFFAVSAHAGSTKIGNVIAIEKELENVYADCLKSFKEIPTKESQAFFCVVKTTDKVTDFTLTKGNVLKYKTTTCLVDAEVAPHSILISFGSPTQALSFSEAAQCLNESISKSPAMKIVMYTLE